jgi:hypothetical protein
MIAFCGAAVIVVFTFIPWGLFARLLISAVAVVGVLVAWLHSDRLPIWLVAEKRTDKEDEGKER